MISGLSPPVYTVGHESDELDPVCYADPLSCSTVTVVQSPMMWDHIPSVQWCMPLSSTTAELRDLFQFYRTNQALYGTISVRLSNANQYRGILYNVTLRLAAVSRYLVIDSSYYTPDMVWLAELVEPLHVRLLVMNGVLHAQLSSKKTFPNVYVVNHPDVSDSFCQIL